MVIKIHKKDIGSGFIRIKLISVILLKRIIPLIIGIFMDILMLSNLLPIFQEYILRLIILVLGMVYFVSYIKRSPYESLSFSQGLLL